MDRENVIGDPEHVGRMVSTSHSTSFTTSTGYAADESFQTLDDCTSDSIGAAARRNKRK
jgi:hypothetical protein